MPVNYCTAEFVLTVSQWRVKPGPGVPGGPFFVTPVCGRVTVRRRNSCLLVPIMIYLKIIPIPVRMIS